MADVTKGGESGAYLGPGTKIHGKLQFDGPATIEGEIEGEIIGQASVTIGQQAILRGKISAVSVVVQGKVAADVQAEKKLEIQPPGLVVGDVNTQSLVIGDGAVFEGHVSMKKEARVLPLRQDAKPAIAGKDNASSQN
jgi:cytoskeletal protein CcmA (bactofilin family)